MEQKLNKKMSWSFKDIFAVKSIIGYFVEHFSIDNFQSI